jgi:hypothetical protein
MVIHVTAKDRAGFAAFRSLALGLRAAGQDAGINVTKVSPLPAATRLVEGLLGKGWIEQQGQTPLASLITMSPRSASLPRRHASQSASGELPFMRPLISKRRSRA